ncbi:inhibitor of apoptosis protein 4 [Dasychira pudibunda nucleopolyhedrovirus]|nr:inhibitor of apoptosis protein 4 [Dasychira pudibunda nucleopolyhedrovirus]WHM28353.1 iap-4 [Dasychira pudibunda nucleopolyhedrovirus]
MAHVKLICVKVNGRLRVRIDDPAYRRDANCTFPNQTLLPFVKLLLSACLQTKPTPSALFA